jgi:hypothetical protein
MTIRTDEPAEHAPIPERQPVRLTDIPFAIVLPDPGDGTPFTWRRTLVDPSSGHAVFNVRFGPGQRGEPHWHPSDTLYVFLAGELTVEGEATYREGEVRFVRGGFAYGAEVGGPNGCEFIFVSLGPYGRFDPDVERPPLGRWDVDPATTAPADG